VEDYSLQDGLQAADLCILLGYNFAGKAAIPAGDFTLAHLFSIFPLPLTMSVVRITGQNVIDSLAEGCQDLPGECGAIHHVSAGLSYVIQIDGQGREKPRVAQALFRGKPLEPERYYTVCLPSSLCTGKYGYIWNVTAEIEVEFAGRIRKNNIFLS
jgi:2',3'-cyclic-nucleotide 2'-phosphodiesterase (5'-nucleotidase family)